jgi:hypothetical protein
MPITQDEFMVMLGVAIIAITIIRVLVFLSQGE